MVPPPPVLFSTNTFTPKISVAKSAINLEVVSPPPPAPYGTINLIGLDGYLSANEFDISKRVIEIIINTPLKIDLKNIYFLPNEI